MRITQEALEREKRITQEALDNTSEAKERAEERAHTIRLEEMRLAQKDASKALERTEFRAQEIKERAADRTHKEELLKTKLLKE